MLDKSIAPSTFLVCKCVESTESLLLTNSKLSSLFVISKKNSASCTKILQLIELILHKS